jgi:hypothetical protein
MRSDRGPSGPVGAHPQKEGHCSNAGGLSTYYFAHYTGIAEFAYAPPQVAARAVYWNSHHCFPESGPIGLLTKARMFAEAR